MCILSAGSGFRLNHKTSIPDIMRHYADCIVAAEKEVFLATSMFNLQGKKN
jgi:hypothetical protein